jgi:RHS repeat-associated protein
MTYSFKQSINLTLPILLVLLLGTPTQATASIDTTALVGSTAAGFSVNQGTANYTIPITVPPGIADMQPKLSINYNSNVGNGQLGVGFSLSGLSAIHRCAKTIVTDGIKGGVNYNNNDRYCLNGQRLIAISGVDGQSGSKYRTEINSFSKIKYNGNYWTVKTKSGQTFEYGNTQNSKIEAQGKSTVRLWAVNKITDVANNAINYIYNEDNVNGEYTLNSIDYANSSINLTYEDRNDVPTSYQAGSKLQQTKRLSNITTHVNNNIVRTYDLEYQYQGAPERSQLTSIEECVDNVCLPKISFLQSNPLTDNNIFKYIGTHGGSGESNTKFYFGDFNGDGMTDYVYHNTSYNDGKFKINLADGTGSFKYIGTHGGSGESNTKFYFGDFNGDGMTDYVYHNTSYNDGKFKINLNTTKNSKVQTITNGFNIQTTINYKPLTDNTVYTKGSNGSYPNIDTQNARQVVSSVTTDNAIGSQNTTTYKYGGAKVNVKGRGNLGFAWIEKKDLQTNKLARTEYSQTYPYIGQITSTKEYIETNNSRQLLNSQTNIHQDKSSYSNKIHAPYSSQSLEKSYDLNSGNLLTTITTQQSNIDNYGNVGTIKVTTTGKNKTFIKTTRNTYNNNATKWHLGRLTASTVTHQAPNIPNIIRTSRFAYNNKGLLKSETIEPNTKKALTTTYNYDSFGNKIKATTSASGIASRSTTTEYSANGKFPIKATNALGHSETKTFDAKTGNILTLTGPNNLTTTWQYDTLGRKKLETRADSTTTSTNYQWAEDESPNSLYKITTTTSGSSPKTTYFDAFNRKVREQHTGFDGRKINSDTYYDNLGRVDRASLPYFTDEQGYFITTQYDAIGRLISSTKPADYGNTATNSTAYNGLTTINTNALGYQKTTTKNAIGKIIRIDEPESAWLTHQHDAIGNLTQTNVGGVTTTMTYDNRGNKISMNDPDMGRWTYTYNALGELINQTDAKNQTSTTSYDKLGRMTQRVEPEGTTNWQYDTKTNGIGKLAKVTALPDYKKEYSYDSLGRIGTTTTHVNNQSFNIQNQYDQYSRLSTQTRPQNFKVENVYNQYGYLMAKRAPKDQISDYDWEHLTKLTQDSLVNVEEALTKANEFEQKANVYRFVAKGYRQYADDATNISAEFTQKAQELRNNADLLEEVVVRLQKEAKQYTDSAKGYLIAARRFQHLSNVNVADDQERSYIDSNTNSKIGGYGFYSGGSIAAQSNTNGYAWCSNQAACVYWANASKQYAIINTNQAKQKLELAQRYINSSGVEKQAFANQEADNYDKKANDYTRYAVNYIDLSNEYLEQAQESVNQAKYWRGVAANAPDYQAMLADTNNIYFWRAKSRDASGRLTGHIVGNGLSTEQQYSPATGHLFAIKSGFGNTDGIRSLEYEYDLMNNVTQRQNHQSGLTEDFQYDELDRLTQSNTTGNIEGVTYNNGTSYQYDINGNITHKSDIGYYRYNPQRPHAIASINSNSPSSTDDYNANTATTGMLTINSSVTGNIETGNDTDWFKITLTAGQQVTFDLEGKPTQSGTLPDPYLRGIYNNTGTLISNTTNDDSGIGVNSKVIFTASTSNTYYISAGAYSRNTGTYTLTAIVTGSGASITPSLSDDYIYDANGNMTKNNNKIIQWTSFNKPKRFTKSNSNDNTTFVYAPNRSRYQKTQTKASSNTTIATTYIGKLYEQIKQNTSTEHKHFIYADGQLIAINIKTDTTTGTPSIPDKTRYLHYDNLGSIDTITNGQGNIVERMAYTAFGQRRQGDWRASDPLLPIIPALTNRGFTGHEHIDEMGFIHMNGRVYDPSIGRFLSVDSTVPYIFKSQSYNRYSYTRNNPLKYKDPSGYYDYNDDWDDDWSDDWDNDWDDDWDNDWDNDWDDDWDNDWDDDYNDWGNDWGSSRNASHVQSNYKITGTANSNDSLSKGGILLDDFTTLKPKNWKQEKTIYDGGSYNFNGGRYLKLESRSNTLGFDPFRYIAKGYPLEVDGSLGSTISGLNWGHYTSSGGLGMGSVRVIDSGLYNQYDTHWVVKIPLQPSTNDNSSGHYINIYHSD